MDSGKNAGIEEVVLSIEYLVDSNKNLEGRPCGRPFLFLHGCECRGCLIKNLLRLKKYLYTLHTAANLLSIIRVPEA